jgi:hypothetical protein
VGDHARFVRFTVNMTPPAKTEATKRRVSLKNEKPPGVVEMTIDVPDEV